MRISINRDSLFSGGTCVDEENQRVIAAYYGYTGNIFFLPDMKIIPLQDSVSGRSICFVVPMMIWKNGNT